MDPILAKPERGVEMSAKLKGKKLENPIFAQMLTSIYYDIPCLQCAAPNNLESV